MESWLNSLSFPREQGSEEPRLYLSEENKEDIRNLYKRMVTPCLDYLRKGGVKVCNCLSNIREIKGQMRCSPKPSFKLDFAYIFVFSFNL